MELTSGARLTERPGRGGRLGRREPKGKMYFHEDATDVRAGWAGQDGFGLRGRRGQWAGWAERPDMPQGRPGRNQEKEFLN
jgi:hypothetical protein